MVIFYHQGYIDRGVLFYHRGYKNRGVLFYHLDKEGQRGALLPPRKKIEDHKIPFFRNF